MFMPIRIFFCYAHKDEWLLNILKAHLSSLQRQGLIDVWYDHDISAGTEWEKEINKYLDKADICLLLVSPDFIDSDYCYSVEMKRALERHEKGEARVVPVILRPVDLKGTPFIKLQALPTNANPVTKWPDRDEAFLDVVQGIRTVVEELIVSVSATPINRRKEILPPQLWNVPYHRNHQTEEIAIYCEDMFRKQRRALIEQVIDLSGNSRLQDNPQESNPLAVPVELLEDLFGDLLPPKRGADTSDSKQNSESITCVRAKLLELARVVLLGEPGSGKTTTIKRLALNYIQQYSENLQTPLPIFVPLSQFTGQTSFTDFAYQCMGNLRPFVNRLSLVWLLDALNEMPQYGPPPHGRSLVNELVDFMKYHDHCRFVVSCRVSDYQNELQIIPGLYRIELRNLNPAQIHDIIFKRLQKQMGEKLWQVLEGSNELIEAEKYFPGTETDFWQDTPKPNFIGRAKYCTSSEWHLKSDSLHGFIWDSLKQHGGTTTRYFYYEHKHELARQRMVSDSRQLMLLCRNPYNLGVIIDLAAAGGIDNIPSNRGLLFERFTKLLLQREEMRAHQQGQLWPKGTTDCIKQSLQSIAVSMHKAGQSTEMNKSEAVNLIGPADAEDLLLKAEAASLIKYGRTIKFTHQLLQEFFASGYMHEAVASGQPATLFWPDHSWWLPQGWEEPAMILAGYADLTTVVRWITPANPLVAEKCLRESRLMASGRSSNSEEWIYLRSYALKKLEELADVIVKKKAIARPENDIVARLAMLTYQVADNEDLERLARSIIHILPESDQMQMMEPHSRCVPLMLWIEDNETIRELLRYSLALFEPPPFMIAECTTNDEAILYTLALHPDFIVSDQSHPGGGIEEFVEFLDGNALTAAIPLSLFTGFSPVPSIQSRIRSFLLKPCRIQGFHLFIQNLLSDLQGESRQASRR